jgi:hypothetical protein
LNLACCHHITDKGLHALSKNCKNLLQINLSNVPHITQEGILNMLSSLNKLQHLDIYDNSNINEERREILMEFSKARHITINLKGLNCNSQTNGNVLSLASAGQYW